MTVVIVRQELDSGQVIFPLFLILTLHVCRYSQISSILLLTKINKLSRYIYYKETDSKNCLLEFLWA
jgi:hypothetical protein